MNKAQTYSDHIEVNPDASLQLSFIEGANEIQLVSTKYIKTEEVEGAMAVEIPLTALNIDSLLGLLMEFKTLLPPVTIQ